MVEHGDVVDGEADVEYLLDWQATKTIADLKAYCVAKNYSGFTLCKDGECNFKKVDYQLNSQMFTVKNTAYIKEHHFYTPEGSPPMREGTWTEHADFDMPGYGDVEVFNDWKDKATVEGLKARA